MEGHSLSPLATSEQVVELYKALNIVQANIEGAKKDSENPYFKSKYADLTSVWAACREALLANGFSVIQSPFSYPHGTDTALVCGVVTRLCHNSGQWIEGQVSALLLVGKPQEVGSAITYLRRYALAAIVGVCPEDDDAEGATNRKPETRKPEAQKPEEKKTEPESKSREALTKLYAFFATNMKGDQIKAMAKEVTGREVAGTKDLTEDELRKLVKKMELASAPKKEAPAPATPAPQDGNYVPAPREMCAEIAKLEEHMGHAAFEGACYEFFGKAFNEDEITESEARALLEYLQALDAPAGPKRPTHDAKGKPIEDKDWAVCGTAKRKGCGKEIYWRTNERTKKPYPVDPETGENHLKTCPIANPPQAQAQGGSEVAF